MNNGKIYAVGIGPGNMEDIALISSGDAINSSISTTD